MQTLNDLNQYVGGDIGASVTGDLLPVVSTTRGQQRILRRLLTNPGDYIFQPEYGAGLPRYVGEVADIAKIRALIRGQVLLEDSVAKSPEPEIVVKAITNGLAVAIRYVDSDTRQPVALSFNVNK